MKSYLGYSNLPRGIRNNNPGNLVLTSIQWQGKIANAQNTDGHFEQFQNVAYGIRAMAMDIIGDISEGKNTLTKLISEYAPSFENDTTAYISRVSSATGIGADELIPKTTTVVHGIIKAKLAVENGAVVFDYITDSDIDDGLALVPEKFLQKKSLLDTLKDNWMLWLAILLVVAVIIYLIIKK